MSRIGKKIIQIPEKTKVEVKGGTVVATGALGSLSYNLPEGFKAEINGSQMNIVLTGDQKALNALHGTTRANINNIVQGVSTGFSKFLEIQGLGYKAVVQGTKLNLELGFSHPVIFDIPKEIKVVVDPKTGTVEVKGSDKFLVGDFAAKIRRMRPPEPYKGSGIRYQGEHVARKAGKTAAGGK